MKRSFVNKSTKFTKIMATTAGHWSNNWGRIVLNGNARPEVSQIIIQKLNESKIKEYCLTSLFRIVIKKITILLKNWKQVS